VPGALLATTTVQATAPSPQQAATPAELTGTSLTPTERITATKTATSSLARTDPALLGRTDATPIEVIVKLDYDSVATYDGSVPDLAPTSPAITGRDLTGTTPAEAAYDDYIVEQEQTFEAAVAEVAPTALIGQSLRTVYGGVAMTVPANSIEALLAIPNVVAVQQDKLNQPLTDASSDFINADALYPALGGTSNAGEGVTVGILDTGAWPEHVSFADQGNLPPPATSSGICDFGDDPTTPAADPFVCNNKLISGERFLETYLSNPTRAADEPYHTARDSNGHGTHTASTSVGNVVESAEVFGVERGPINGIAPGAHLAVYKVCGIQGCFDSDTSAAVAKAVEDGVDVINFSISGGTSPFTDPTELAFLDAYEAGVFVAASGGNDGPTVGTVNHLSPWVTTVAASTQRREFASTLTLRSGSLTFQTAGASITAGIAGPLPVVMASSVAGYDQLCLEPADPGVFEGVIVACARGNNARVDKGFNVLQGGAAGMILYNPTLADVETDNHWLPTVHLADGREFVQFMTGRTNVTGSFTAGVARDGQPDVMAAFSSRGPGGLFIKPDITAPGVQILAGHTPTPEASTEGPPGEFFQAIAGTSMSSPHIAGSAALMAALRPEWTPGQIKSALMTTAIQDVVKEDGTTPADPLDFGSGRVDLALAAMTGLTFDASADDMNALGDDPVGSVQLNVPSINAPVMPGRLVVERVATNVSGKRARYGVTATSPEGSTITVSPARINLAAGGSVVLTVTIESDDDSDEFQFGQIDLTPSTAGLAAQHLPVAFQVQPGVVSLTSSCTPDQILVRSESRCTVTAQNNSYTDAEVDLSTSFDNKVRITEVDGAQQTGNRSVRLNDQALTPAAIGVPSVAPGTGPFGYQPLDRFGIGVEPIGDEEIINFTVPAFTYNGLTYTSVGVDTNGYVIAGGGSSEDNNCCELPAGASPARPNDIMAPFWTDLDGTGAPGILAGVLRAGANRWIVVEHRVNVWGTTDQRRFQVWIGLNGVQDVSFAYAAPQADPAGQAFLVGAENANGAGALSATLPTGGLVVRSTAAVPGGIAAYTVWVRGIEAGTSVAHSEMTTSLVPGVTVSEAEIEVLPR
jgi:hypothetical protein